MMVVMMMPGNRRVLRMTMPRMAVLALDLQFQCHMSDAVFL